MKPRIGFDARLWRHTGIGRYIRNLAPALEEVELTAYVHPEDAEELQALAPQAIVEPCTAKPFSIQEQRFFRKELARQQFDLFHAPHLNVPLMSGTPLVVTIHDLIPLRFPGTINSRLGAIYFRGMSHLAVGRAERVIAVSANTREDLIALLGADPGKVRVIGEGADARFAMPVDPARIEAVRTRYGLEGPYVLYAGQWKRYKNLETLLAAFSSIADRHPGLKLVLAGREDPKQGHVIRRIRELGIDDRVVRTGWIADEADLAALFQAARVFAFPSRYEGFGLPPLEAMAAGVPVVASRAASIPEVVGDAALMVDPDDMLEWCEALERALTDEALRRRLVKGGRERLRVWRWDEAASRTVEVYREVLQGIPS